MLQMTKEKETYLEDLDALQAVADNAAPTWMGRLRQNGVERFAELSFPTTKDEDWKYTNVAPVLRVPFRTSLDGNGAPLSTQDVDDFCCRATDWAQLVFVNGRYAGELSSVANLPGGVVVGGLALALTLSQTESEPLAAAMLAAEAQLGKHAGHDRLAFVALNTAFLNDVAFIYVPDGKIVDAPIHVLLIARGEGAEVASHPRVLVVLGRGSAATVVESYVSLGNGRTFSNAVSELVLGEEASLSHYKLLREREDAFHIGTTQVHQERDSSFTSFLVAIGDQLARNDLNVTLAAPGAECTLNGLYMTEGTQHVDNHTAIEHATVHGSSRQLYKGVLDGRSRAVFNGKVFVRPGADGTDAQQANRNLILSDAALVDTKPQLEILADDVKCSHGAAIGQLDEDQVFYLRSRGMSEHLARTLLTYGFASEVINKMKLEPIRVELDRILLTRLEPEADPEDLPDGGAA